MGPRPEGRGRNRLNTVFPVLTMYFNGATARRPWTATALVPDPKNGSNFNGATARRPWTDVTSAWLPPCTTALQWGHGPKAVDGGPRRLCDRREIVTSMGPRPEGRGRCLPPLREAAWWNGFNGATARRPWTDQGCGNGRSATAASMGPRPEGRGRHGIHQAVSSQAKLQWGHGPKAVDGRTACSTSPRG